MGHMEQSQTGGATPPPTPIPVPPTDADLIHRLRRAGTAVYLATDKTVADDISGLMFAAAARVEQQTPAAARTDAEFRTAIHSAVRNGIESVDVNAPADREMVRAVADRVLSLIAVVENASSASRSPNTGFESARIAGVSIERPGVGLGSTAVGAPVDLDALEALARAQVIAIDQMHEVGRGVGGMTRANLAAYIAWEDGTDGYGHADTALHLIERLRRAETQRPYVFCEVWRRIDGRSCILAPGHAGTHAFSRHGGARPAEEAR